MDINEIKKFKYLDQCGEWIVEDDGTKSFLIISESNVEPIMKSFKRFIFEEPDEDLQIIDLYILYVPRLNLFSNEFFPHIFTDDVLRLYSKYPLLSTYVNLKNKIEELRNSSLNKLEELRNSSLNKLEGI